MNTTKSVAMRSLKSSKRWCMTFNTHSNYQLTTQNDYKRMPWKNGLGENPRNLSKRGRKRAALSHQQAAVKDDGVFSNFEGLSRTLVLLSGQGMQLSHKSIKGNVAEHCLKSPLDMARFAGGDETLATLNNAASKIWTSWCVKRIQKQTLALVLRRLTGN